MQGLKYIARLILPSLLLGGLYAYSLFLTDDRKIPLALTLGLTLAMGFFSPTGSWRWAILIAFGVDLADAAGSLIDSQPIPGRLIPTPMDASLRLGSALIAAYLGVFLKKRLLGRDEDAEPEFLYIAETIAEARTAAGVSESADGTVRESNPGGEIEPGGAAPDSSENAAPVEEEESPQTSPPSDRPQIPAVSYTEPAPAPTPAALPGKEALLRFESRLGIARTPKENE